MTDRHILITGGAGYIGSLLTSELLRLNYRVTVLDSLLFGGESLVPFLHHPNFNFVKADVTKPRCHQGFPKRWLAETRCHHPPCCDCGIPCLSGGRQASLVEVQCRSHKNGFRAGNRLGRGKIRVCVHI